MYLRLILQFPDQSLISPLREECSSNSFSWSFMLLPVVWCWASKKKNRGSRISSEYAHISWGNWLIDLFCDASHWCFSVASLCSWGETLTGSCFLAQCSSRWILRALSVRMACLSGGSRNERGRNFFFFFWGYAQGGWAYPNIYIFFFFNWYKYEHKLKKLRGKEYFSVQRGLSEL